MCKPSEQASLHTPLQLKVDPYQLEMQSDSLQSEGVVVLLVQYHYCQQEVGAQCHQ